MLMLTMMLLFLALFLQAALSFKSMQKSPKYSLRKMSSTTTTSNNNNLPPGKKGKWPLFGDTFQLINAKTMGSYQTNSRAKYGDIWKTSIFFKPTIFVTGKENLKSIFTEEAKKKTSAFFPPHHQTLFGSHSLLVQSGSYHAKLRRVIQQALTPQVIEQFDALLMKQAREFVAGCNTEKEAFKFVDKARNFFVKLAVSVLLGNDITAMDAQNLSNDISIWSKGLLSAPLTFIPWSTASRAMRARKRIAIKLTTIIEDYRSRILSSSTMVPKDMNLLFRLVAAKDDVDNDFLSTEAIVDNIFTLVFAGSDTTASVLTSTIKMLSENDTLQESLRTSADTATTTTTTVALETLLKDVMTQNPPAPFSMRLVGDEPLYVNGYQVPSNWLVAYGYAGTLLAEGVDSTYGAVVKSENHVAFGGGPRMCPGRFLALKELLIVMKEILGSHGFRWKLEPNQNLQQTYTPGYFPSDGLLLKTYSPSN